MQPYICKKVIERTNPILDTLATWYTQQAFFVLIAQTIDDMDGLVQERHTAIANALELFMSLH